MASVPLAARIIVMTNNRIHEYHYFHHIIAKASTYSTKICVYSAAQWRN